MALRCDGNDERAARGASLAARDVDLVPTASSPRPDVRPLYNVLWIQRGAVAGDAGDAADPPALNDLALLGVRFTQAYAARFYVSDVAEFSRIARRHRMATRALLSARMPTHGFDEIVDYKPDSTSSPAQLVEAAAWIERMKRTPFFLYVNARTLRPSNASPALDSLFRAVVETNLLDRTIVVITSDHVEQPSAKRIPLVVVANGLLPPRTVVTAMVRNTDVAPTLTELLGFEASAAFGGVSLVALARGHAEADARAVVNEAPRARSFRYGSDRLRVADSSLVKGRRSLQLYDTTEDPDERRDLSRSHPERLAEMRARLAAFLDNEPVAGSVAAVSSPSPEEWSVLPVVKLRFAAAPRSRRVSGSIMLGEPSSPPRAFTIDPVGLGREAIHVTNESVEFAFSTSSTVAVGFNLVVDPPTSSLRWTLYGDDLPWPKGEFFGGPFGLLMPDLRLGLTTDDARLDVEAPSLPVLEPHRESGLFVVRERRAGSHARHSETQRE